MRAWRCRFWPPMSFPHKVASKVLWTRPLPQLRILWTYRVSPFRHPRVFARLVLQDRELSNFTYGLANVDELVEFVASCLGRPPAEIAAYMREIEADDELDDALRRRLAGRRDRNPIPLFGRRLGWYCFARAAKPRLAVETGTADGLGTALLARALELNAAEGAPGELLSFDIDARSGWLLSTRAREGVHLIVGDARETLPRALEGRQIDLFVHDSDHSYQHERWELDFAVDHGATSLVLISDNAHATPALREVCDRVEATFHYFQEQPVDHFYPGAGIGMALVRRSPGADL